VEEVVGGSRPRPDLDLETEYECTTPLDLERRPAAEVERVDGAVVAHGVECPAVAVEGAVAALRVARRRSYPSPVRVARPRE
jgi:hypothetical protein